MLRFTTCTCAIDSSYLTIILCTKFSMRLINGLVEPGLIFPFEHVEKAHFCKEKLEISIKLWQKSK